MLFRSVGVFSTEPWPRGSSLPVVRMKVWPPYMTFPDTTEGVEAPNYSLRHAGMSRLPLEISCGLAQKPLWPPELLHPPLLLRLVFRAHHGPPLAGPAMSCLFPCSHTHTHTPQTESSVPWASASLCFAHVVPPAQSGLPKHQTPMSQGPTLRPPLHLTPRICLS